MSTSPIAHSRNSGDPFHTILSLSILKTLDPQKITILSEIGIHSLGDLLHYRPIHYARTLMSIARGEIAHKVDLTYRLDTEYLNTAVSQLPATPIIAIEGIGEATANTFRVHFNIQNIEQLAAFPPFMEAQAYLVPADQTFNDPPSAPSELLPQIIGAVASTVRYSTIIREKDLRGFTLETIAPEDIIYSPISDIFGNDGSAVIYLGYIAGHSQRWVNLGTHLGEINHSIPLAPGESRNIAVLDWKRSHLTRRDEDGKILEQINSIQTHKRALDEITRAVAEEHQFGKTSTESNTAVTSSSFVAGGALVGGIGGGIVGGASGGITGLIIDTESGGGTLTVGSATLWGAGIGTGVGAAVGSIAGAAAGGLIYSGATAIGLIESDTSGNRDIIADVHQRITQGTSQKSSAIRSLWSTVVLENYEGEEKTIQTTNITNYNHMHALTIQYYEVLQHYRAEIALGSAESVIFLPFRPLDFTWEKIEALLVYLQPALEAELPEELFNTAFTDPPKPEKVEIPPDPEFQFNPDETNITEFVVKTIVNTGVSTIGAEIILTTGEVIPLYRREEQTPNSKYFQSNDPNDKTPPLPGTLSWADPYIDNFWPMSNRREDHFFANEPIPVDKIQNIRILNSGTGIKGELEIAYALSQDSQTQDLKETLDKIGDLDLELGNNTQDFSWDIYHNLETKYLQFKEELDAIEAAIQQQDDLDKAHIAEIEIQEEAKKEIEKLVLWNRYHYTRIILSRAEPEQFINIFDNLKITFDNMSVWLHSIAHTIPIGISGTSFILKLKHLNEEQAIRAIETVGDTDFDKDKLLSSPFNQLFVFPRDINRWLEGTEKYTIADDIYLPTSGVFAEAILGRSNAAEKLDMTRHTNWHETPIPHIAPEILPIEFNYNLHQDEGVEPTIPPATINLVAPPNFPDPTGLAGVLQAIQNPNIFRDMSKSDQLTTILGGLATLAGEMGKASSQMTGEAAKQALLSATEMGKTVADLTKSLSDSTSRLAANPPSNMTEKGATLNELTKLLKDGDVNPLIQDAVGVGDKKKENSNKTSGEDDSTDNDSAPPKPPLPNPIPSSSERVNRPRHFDRTIHPDIKKPREEAREDLYGNKSFPIATVPRDGYLDGSFLLSDFQVNRSEIHLDHQGALAQIAHLIQSSDQARVYLEGHASKTGPEQNNIELSEDRALAAYDWLTDVYRVPVEKIVRVLGVGSAYPPGSPKEGVEDLRNRSVIIYYSIPVADVQPDIPPVTSLPDKTSSKWRISIWAGLSSGVKVNKIDGIGGTFAVIALKDDPDGQNDLFVYADIALGKFLLEEPTSNEETAEFSPSNSDLIPQAKILKSFAAVWDAVWENMWGNISFSRQEVILNTEQTTPIKLDEFNQTACNFTIIHSGGSVSGSANAKIVFPELGNASATVGSLRFGNASLQSVTSVGNLYPMPDYIKSRIPESIKSILNLSS